MTRLQTLAARHNAARAYKTRPMPHKRARAFAAMLRRNPAYVAESVTVRGEVGFAYGGTFDRGLSVVEYCRAAERKPRPVTLTDEDIEAMLDMSSL